MEESMDRYIKFDNYYYTKLDQQHEYPSCDKHASVFPFAQGYPKLCNDPKCIWSWVARKRKIPDDTYKYWTYMTIAPDKDDRGSIDIKDLDKLEKWARSWFGDWHYDEYFYAIELGKHKDEPFLHIHAIVKGCKRKLKKNGHFKTLMDEWNSNFDAKCITSGSKIAKDLNGKSVDILWQNINSKELWQLKYNYLNNDLKGTHRNFDSLGVPQGSGL